ncbi:hypothetical protein CPB84DRAFT_1816937 [Gymnopilus junonius]|uniref:FAD-binding PCMH-type domain-containing protein n=1 Tax=Gymnopilus junonius TaxID=109634 RepID=A0A9P5NGZ8_GYMJU|nr:hypothetical protein CPB84DRAFT_1816937 [Gymnopilus junonius]
MAERKDRSSKIYRSMPALLPCKLPSLKHYTCLYGQPCWPDPGAFSALASQVSQPLLHSVPPASACYRHPPLSENCSDVTTHYKDGVWRSNHPGAMQMANFETFISPSGSISACYLNQGSIPPIGVNATSVHDVQAAVKFANRNNLRLVIKNTGHDYLGRSAGKGGFMLWTHSLKEMTYSSSFIPDGAPSNGTEVFNAVTFGAGVQWFEAYAFAHQQGRFVVGGISFGGSIGAAGGWIMGAGHSALSPTLGLGVDNVLQFSVVLADGSLVVANAYQHSDLFWALRGGGGGTYGVVVSATYKTYADFPLTLYILSEVVTQFIRLHPTISDAGWGGYSSITPSNLRLAFAKPNATVADANSTFAPLTNLAFNATGGNVQTLPLSYPSFLDWFNAFFRGEAGQVGIQLYIANRLLPRKLAVENPAKAAKLMLSIPRDFSSVAGGAVSRVDPSSTGLNPSWRGALSEVYITETWPEGSSAATIAQHVESLKKDTDIIDQLTTDSGSYLNEASLFEKDFKKSFFGPHYSKLKSIKNKHDPASLFVVAEGVGSDEWDSDLECRVNGQKRPLP